MLTHPKTSTEWGTYNFSHAPTTKSGTCPCTPLQALRLSKNMVLTDLYRIRNLPQIWQGVFSTKSGHPIQFFWCTFMIFRNIKTSTEWGTYSFSQLQNCPSPKSGTSNCISLQALRLSKKMVLADPPGVLIFFWGMIFPESACEGFFVKKQPLY